MKKKQFIYVLKLVPHLLYEKNWTDTEEKIVNRHFEVLEKLQQQGKLILAGRTMNFDEKTFGIVIFEAESEQDAYIIMENDPAVKEKVMTAELFPYRVALMAGMTKN